MLPLGSKAPDFSLPDTEAKTVSRSDFEGKFLLVVFMCNHCPYVRHLRKGLADFGREYRKKGLAMVGINANDVENYPEDHPDTMKTEAASAGYTFPYLFDATQKTAKAYQAACTPDFFLFDKEHRLVYRGQFDESRPGNNMPVTGADLRTATDALLAGQPVAADQRPSIGCNIKWKL